MKILKRMAFVFAAALAAVTLVGCSIAVGISEISLTSSDGNVDTYTIYYTDGTTSTFTVTNGTDGKDGVDGASEVVSISEISLTSSDGNVDTYTIYYTDGTTDMFTVTNGADGENSTVTIADIYAAYQEVYGESLSYSDFLTLYLAGSDDGTTAVGSCLQSSMKVYSEYSVSTRIGGVGGVQSITAKTYGAGSAVIYQMDDNDTFIVTNYHVVYSSNYGLSDTFHAYLYGSEGEPESVSKQSGYTTEFDYGEYAITCEYVGGSITADIAVLRADTADVLAINENAAPVTVGSGYAVGETVYAIGNAEDYGISVTKGIISVESEYIELQIDSTTREYRSIRIDAVIYSGNSGGGLFNEYGELIGINNAGSSSYSSINYAIPLEIVTGTADNILYYYRDGDSSTNGAYVANFGAELASKNARYVYDSSTGNGKIEETVYLEGVDSSSFANSLGLQAGDVLVSVSINGTAYAITRSFTLNDLFLTVRAGDSIAFSYLRNDAAATTEPYTLTSSDLTAKA